MHLFFKTIFHEKHLAKNLQVSKWYKSYDHIVSQDSILCVATVLHIIIILQMQLLQNQI